MLTLEGARGSTTRGEHSLPSATFTANWGGVAVACVAEGWNATQSSSKLGPGTGVGGRCHLDRWPANANAASAVLCSFSSSSPAVCTCEWMERARRRRTALGCSRWRSGLARVGTRSGRVLAGRVPLRALVCAPARSASGWRPAPSLYRAPQARLLIPVSFYLHLSQQLSFPVLPSRRSAHDVSPLVLMFGIRSYRWSYWSSKSSLIIELDKLVTYSMGRSL